MDTFEILAMGALNCLLLILLFLYFRKLVVSRETNLSPLFRGIYEIQSSLTQLDRSARDEFSRSRQEQGVHSQGLRTEVLASVTGIGDSLSSKVESFTRSTDQRLELLRSSVEHRIDSFGLEAARKSDTLSEGLNLTLTKLALELSAKLSEFNFSFNTTLKEIHTLQDQQTDAIAGSIRSLESDIDEKQQLVQTTVEARLSAVAHRTGESLSNMETSLRTQAQQLREETAKSFKNLGDSILSTLTAISQMQNNELNEIRNTVDSRLITIQVENDKRLEQMRQTVDERLEGTLEARLGESFKQVSERLEQVYVGLGEMKTLTTGVGDLKRVLTNVKVRGTWGETQLGAIIEEMLTPDQFGKNVATSGTGERVEYAVKLPGRDSNDQPVWLPIDAKFPVEDYDRLIEASERGDVEAIEEAARHLEGSLRSSARAVGEKYLDPPSTTDFGILFLPTEGLYAEAMRRTGLAESIQREHRVILSGPSTLAALLSAFQMGFRTLAVQKRSSEVWEILSLVKTEFGKYSGLLVKVKKKLTEAQNTIDRVDVRTRAIRRTLQSVEGSEILALPEEAEGEGETEERPPASAGVTEEDAMPALWTA